MYFRIENHPWALVFDNLEQVQVCLTLCLRADSNYGLAQSGLRAHAVVPKPDGFAELVNSISSLHLGHYLITNQYNESQLNLIQ